MMKASMKAKRFFQQDMDRQYKEFKHEDLDESEDGNLYDIQGNTIPQSHDVSFQFEAGKSFSQVTLSDYTSSMKARQHLRQRHGSRQNRKSRAYSQKPSVINTMVQNKRINPSISDSKSSCINAVGTRYQNSLNAKLQGLDEGIVMSQLGGSRFRASTSLVFKDRRFVILLLWAVPVSISDLTTNNYFGLKAVPILNCSKLDNVYIANSFDSVIRELKISLCQQLNVDDPSGEKLFHEVSSLIIRQKGNILGSLIKSISDIKNGSSGFSRVKKSFDQLPIKVEYFSDYFDIYEDVEIAEQTSISNETLSGSAFDVLSTNDKEGYCMICFDSFNETELYLSSCKHKACTSCWRGMVLSSSMSGNARIKCPAYKCKNLLSLRDSVHIMVDDDLQDLDSDNDKTQNTVLKMTKYLIEDYLVNKKPKYCETPSCNGFVMQNPISSSNVGEGLSPADRGTKICLCSCGSMICQKCNESAHVGLLCDEYKQIKKHVMSGEIFGELMSVKWVKKNTTPCPKCRYPIKKDGGCNHVNCARCHYYFCWVCGGDGTGCGSFRCSKTGFSSFGKQDVISYSGRTGPLLREETMMSELSSILKELFTVKTKLQSLILEGDQSSHKCEREKEWSQELQLRQSLIWTNEFIISKYHSKSEAFLLPLYMYRSNLNAALQELRCEEGGTKEIDINKYLDAERDLVTAKRQSIPKQKRYKQLSKHSKRVLKEEHRNDENQCFEAYDIINHAIVRSSTQNNTQLGIYIARIVNEVVKDLSGYKPKKKSGLKKATSKTEYVNLRLNQKGLPRKASWKNNQRRDDGISQSPSEDDQEDAYSTYPEMALDRKNKKWKGKNIVKARRYLSSDLCLTT